MPFCCAIVGPHTKTSKTLTFAAPFCSALRGLHTKQTIPCNFLQNLAQSKMARLKLKDVPEFLNACKFKQQKQEKRHDYS